MAETNASWIPFYKTIFFQSRKFWIFKSAKRKLQTAWNLQYLAFTIVLWHFVRLAKYIFRRNTFWQIKTFTSPSSFVTKDSLFVKHCWAFLMGNIALTALKKTLEHLAKWINFISFSKRSSFFNCECFFSFARACQYFGPSACLQQWESSSSTLLSSPSSLGNVYILA